MSDPSFAGSSRCTSLSPRKLLSPWQFSFTVSQEKRTTISGVTKATSINTAKISASGASTNIAFSPIHLLTAFNNDWLSHKYSFSSSEVSACHEVLVKMLPKAHLSWSPPPLVPRCNAAFSFSFSNYHILRTFCPFNLNHHLQSLGPSLHACLFVCSSSNRVLSFSNTLILTYIYLFPGHKQQKTRDTSSFILILRNGGSKC